jgi:hypothetical protein
MPLARYFFFIGGVLLALLFISDAVLPKLPMAAGTDGGTDKSSLRINSDRKWPERVVFDTSIPPIAPVQTAATEEVVTPPATDAVADVSARTRDACATRAFRPEKAGAEAAPETQNCKKAPRPADRVGSPTAAVWLFRQHYLVSLAAAVLE